MAAEQPQPHQPQNLQQLLDLRRAGLEGRRQQAQGELERINQEEAELLKWRNFLDHQPDLESRYHAARHGLAISSQLQREAIVLGLDTRPIEEQQRAFIEAQRQLEEQIPQSYREASLTGPDAPLVRRALDRRVRQLEGGLNNLEQQIQAARQRNEDIAELEAQRRNLIEELNDRRGRIHHIPRPRERQLREQTPHLQDAHQEISEAERRLRQAERETGRNGRRRRVRAEQERAEGEHQKAREGYLQARRNYDIQLALTEVKNSPDFITLSEKDFRRRVAERLSNRMIESPDEDAEIIKARQSWILRVKDEYHKHPWLVAGLTWGANIGLGLAVSAGAGLPAALLFITRAALATFGTEGVWHHLQYRGLERQLNEPIDPADLHLLTPEEKAKRAAVLHEYRIRRGIVEPTEAEKRLIQSIEADLTQDLTARSRITKAMTVNEAARKLNRLTANDNYFLYREQLKEAIEEEKRSRLTRWIGSAVVGVLGTLLLSPALQEIRESIGSIPPVRGPVGLAPEPLLPPPEAPPPEVPPPAAPSLPEPPAPPPPVAEAPPPEVAGIKASFPGPQDRPDLWQTYTFGSPDPVLDNKDLGMVQGVRVLDGDNVSSQFGKGQAALADSFLTPRGLIETQGDRFDPFNGQDALAFNHWWEENRSLGIFMVNRWVDAIDTFNPGAVQSPNLPDAMFHTTTPGCDYPLTPPCTPFNWQLPKDELAKQIFTEAKAKFFN